MRLINRLILLACVVFSAGCAFFIYREGYPVPAALGFLVTFVAAATGWRALDKDGMTS